MKPGGGPYQALEIVHSSHRSVICVARIRDDPQRRIVALKALRVAYRQTEPLAHLDGRACKCG